MSGLIALAWYTNGRFTSIETNIGNLKDAITNLTGRMDNAFGMSSPISLKPAGIDALEKSGLKKWIDDNKPRLLRECGSAFALSNQYDIQEAAFKLFDKVDFGDFEQSLKSAAFSRGWSMEIIRRVGGIYFRDLCLKEHNFKPEDLDKPQASN